jgi:hypothetical protein
MLVMWMSGDLGMVRGIVIAKHAPFLPKIGIGIVDPHRIA